MKKFKDQEKKWNRSKPRPFIIESRWTVGSRFRKWSFFKPFATLEAAVEAVEANLGKINFVEYRLMIKGEEQWIKS